MAAAYEGLAEVTISAEYFGAEAVKSENPQVSIALRGARRIWKKSYVKHCRQEACPRATWTVSD
ncbi:hypothetical protein ALP20_200213 [Pseudomonas coronafaciens pv. coronafaciens]|nr:hypothetical protein ALP20_200213 [Pseudomonas coronafaciens pv. coronafaciens]